MSQDHYFHFTIGPVQDFVSQARRTRDYWAGSFLLSWLSGVAMQSTIHQLKDKGEILYPKPNEHFLTWLATGNGSEKDKPKQGNIPNRFKARINAGVDFEPKLIIDSVQEAWKTIADLVYRNDIAHSATEQTKAIWDRQINDFWEINWAITSDEKDSSILDRRKNWRYFSAFSEHGVKCMMMAGYQELSGAERPNQESLKAFWKDIHNNSSKGMMSDFYEGEALCAIAFVKRRFVHYFQEIQGEPMPSGWMLYGWELDTAVPSVSYMAAVHWLKAVMEASKQNTNIENRLKLFEKAAYELTKDRGGWENDINCIKQLIDSKDSKRQASHDGNVFFQTVIENPNIYPDQKQARRVINAFNKLNQAVDIAAASPFYGVLAMDGDKLGRNLSEPAKQPIIAEKLAKFTRNAQTIVYQNNGFLIYAGGDDVLAILPLEDAMNCAKALRDDYHNCFSGTSIHTSLSGAIEYAHIKMPLTKVLQDAHELLDDVAKEQTGRDALAIRVWKPGGRALQWSQPWEHLIKDDNIVLQQLADDFSKQDSQLTNQFFFKIQAYFKLSALDEEHIKSIMAMEYLNSFNNRTLDKQDALAAIAPLFEQCAVHYRDETGKVYNTLKMNADGALLIRFLAQKGVER